jgi:hypothetical protein
LARIFHPITEAAILSMFRTRQDLARRAIARQFIRHEHPRHVGQALQQFANELLGCSFIPPPLRERIQNVAVLIHRLPEVTAWPVDGQQDLIEVTVVT